MNMYVLLVGAKTKTYVLCFGEDRCDTERNCQIFNKYLLLMPLHHYINAHIAYRPNNESDKLTWYKIKCKEKGLYKVVTYKKVT